MKSIVRMESRLGGVTFGSGSGPAAACGAPPLFAPTAVELAVLRRMLLTRLRKEDRMDPLRWRG